MADPAKRGATYQDVLDAPAHKVAEIVDGELHVSPRPAMGHAAVTRSLNLELGGPFDRGRGGPGGWLILIEPEVHLGADIVVPDLAGWRRERLSAVNTTDAFTSVAPDWVCEVLSPSTRRFDRAEKLPLYARARVSHIWLIEPRDRMLEVLRLEGERWLLLGSFHDDARVRAEPFDAIELELALLWADLAG